MVLGVIAAIKQNTWVDYLATATSVIGYSMPNFVIASVLVLLFAVYLYNWSGGVLYYEVGWEGTYGTLARSCFPPLRSASPTPASWPVSREPACWRCSGRTTSAP